MAKFCTGCGKELSDGLMFCTGCGTKVPEGAPAESTSQAEAVKEEIPPAAEVIKEPVAVQAQPAPQPAPQIDERYAPVNTSYFFWMQLVFALPFIGWIICIICAFAPKNESKKHFARAILIWGIVGLIITAIVVGISLALGVMVGGIVNEALPELEEFTSQLPDVTSAMETFTSSIPQ